MNNFPQSTGATVLELRDVSKWYGKGESRFQALDSISLSIKKGESVAIVGKSGSGKSTLMHILAMLDTPDSGALLIEGLSAASLPKRQVNRLRNRMFGFVFQQFFLTGSTSVLDNVTLPLKIARVGAGERRRRGLEVLSMFDLADKAKNKATDLSGGQKQRVVLSRALVGQPEVVFADEPTGNLDSASGAVVEEELFTLNRDHGITLVIVTHDEELAARCDRQLHIRDGKIDTALEARA
jgi:putative ABC transport system ATP-binding protein